MSPRNGTMPEHEEKKNQSLQNLTVDRENSDCSYSEEPTVNKNETGEHSQDPKACFSLLTEEDWKELDNRARHAAAERKGHCSQSSFWVEVSTEARCYTHLHRRSELRRNNQREESSSSDSDEACTCKETPENRITRLQTLIGTLRKDLMEERERNDDLRVQIQAISLEKWDLRNRCRRLGVLLDRAEDLHDYMRHHILEHARTNRNGILTACPEILKTWDELINQS